MVTDFDGMDRIKSVVALDDENLLVQLGEILVGGDANTRGEKFDDLRRRAENWLQRNRRDLADAICGNPKVMALKGDTLAEVGAIADLLTGCFLDYAGALTVAAILVNRGLDKLCRDR